ncbi:hypothetical protein TELCIR_11134 [Teladorsagia circumcincta]|uniref:Uncharacterized protein n=1 Tax=Teladorsagia circumcincta TaxID=45464 RepID=A0A2G9UBL0_TELCI|nr:hypothetical protein TELCIR_11134 [Teladorsagia circumcincta]
MLLHPEFVPQTWGGGVLLKRKQQAVADAEQKRHATVAEDQTVRDDDITETAAQKQKTPAAPQRKVEASPQKVLKSPVAKVEPREKKSSSESLVGKTDKEKPPVKAELKPSPIRRAPSKAEKKTVEPSPPPKKLPTPAPAPQPMPNHNKPTTPAPAPQPLPNHNNIVTVSASYVS